MIDLRARLQELADAATRDGTTPGPAHAIRRGRQRRHRVAAVTASLVVALAADRGRRLQRQTRALLRTGPSPAVPPASVEAMALVEALRTLPMHQRQAIVLHHLVDLPIEEVSATLGVPTGTVKSWLARGRRTLAARLGDPEEVRS